MKDELIHIDQLVIGDSLYSLWKKSSNINNVSQHTVINLMFIIAQ